METRDRQSRWTLAPTWEEWNQLTDEQKARVVAELPSDEPHVAPPEGMLHSGEVDRTKDALQGHLRRLGRRALVARDLIVHYPGEPWFSPDLLVVLDVGDHDRQSWVVTHEGKGLDFVLEVIVSGDRRKDLTRNPARYARLGIPEYFVFDRPQERLVGYRLDPERAVYKPVLGQRGRFSSEVLGLDLLVEQGRLRFMHGNGLVLDSRELIGRLEEEMSVIQARADALAERLADEERRREEEQRRREEEQRRREEEQRRREEEQRRREDAERRIAELEEELARRGR